MNEFRAIVARNGQITVPDEIRRTLDLRQGDTVVFVVRNGRVELARVDGVEGKRHGSADDLRHAALEKMTREGFEPPPILGA